jgi:endoglucanase
VFDSDYIEVGDGLIKARALDDRAGCAVLISLIQSELEYDMTFTFTVQEELGSRGAKTAAFAVEPRAAVIVEATTAADIADVPEDGKVCFLKKGPVLSFMDGGAVYDRALYELAFETAAERGLPCQPKLAVAGGNNAAAVHVSKTGVRTLAVSVPCRYLHSGSCVIAKTDLYHTAALVKAAAEKIAGSEI